jgi:hypothetical protein
MIEDCGIFHVVDEGTAASCSIALPDILVHEDVTGPMPTLPGNIQMGNDGSAPAPPAPSLIYSAGSQPSNSASPLPGDVFKQSAAYEPPAAAAASTSSPVEAPSPVITTPPAASASDTQSIFSTEYITAGDVVSEILWVEDIVYVTEYEDVTTTVLPTTLKKRDAKANHAHFHRHVHHHGRF